mmetsp:Transcript_7140/g.10761  ORF Transcript_7140/g.10761 Transcript_7140/m.10761 type:complete len:162 (-) Transcript_7140:1777-2262(-)
MLVTSVTTAVCFYSNTLSVMLVVREFGVFMGTVVLMNYFHVMTILPSAMLVSDMYLVPLWKRLGSYCSEVRWHKQSGSGSETSAQSATSSDNESDSSNNIARGQIKKSLTHCTSNESSSIDEIETAKPIVQHVQEHSEIDVLESTPIDIDRMNRIDRWLFS